MEDVVLRQGGDRDLHPLVAVQGDGVAGFDAQHIGQLLGEDCALPGQLHGLPVQPAAEVDEIAEARLVLHLSLIHI